MTGIECEKIGPLTLRAWGLLTALIVWTLYLLTLAPTVGFWDTSEYVTTAHIVGLPHPPGNPFFVIVGRVWDLLLGFTGLPVALRINALGATLSAGASFFWFLTVARIVARFRQDRREVLVASIVAVWIGATAFTVWTQSNLNEKVYPLSMFIVAVVSYLALVWLAEADTSRGNRLLILMALLLGLGWSNHTMSLLPGLALAAFVLLHRWRAPLNPRVLGLGIALLAVGYSLQLLFVPIRSAQNPIIDEADPECPTLVSAVTPKRITDRYGKSKVAVACEPLALSLIRDQYAPPPIEQRQAPLSAQMANYWQYFDWQWARSLPPGARLAASILFLFLALVGLWTHLRNDRKTFIYAGTLFFTVTLLLVYYLNFRYGYSIYWDEAPGIAAHEVRERDYFFIIGFQLWGIYAGLGLVSLWGRWTASEPSGAPERPPGFSARHRKAAALLAVGLIPLVFNFTRADRSDERAARNWAHNMLQSVEPYAVLFTYGDNDTFPLWYLQEVEGIRRDVTVIVQSYLGTDWYHRQLRRLTKPCEPGESPEDSPTTRVCQRPFDPTTAPSLYAEADATTPTRAAVPPPDSGIDDLQRPLPVTEDSTYRLSDWVTGTVRGGDVVSPWDIRVFQIAQQSLGDRPVYFAATAGQVWDKWQLRPHLVRHGLAFKLVDAPLEASETLVDLSEHVAASWVPTWNDRARTGALLEDVYLVDDLLEMEVWPEPSSRSSIPSAYSMAHAFQGISEELHGNVEAAERAYRRANHFARLAASGGESPSD
ncbi:DUF2723 domain-containing protein [Candidatus Palauibacter sp.]|uniref:glycosyltransferase family 117 protein n=1 Tax=Candidatus Palauibacter sp. TaxID=3101350 RepID=UPI003AF302EE